MPRDGDIRFDRRPVAVEHESARGEIVRNVGAFSIDDDMDMGF